MTDGIFMEMISDLRNAVRTIEKHLITINQIGDAMLHERYAIVSDGPLPVKQKNEDVYKTPEERSKAFKQFCNAQAGKGRCLSCPAYKTSEECMFAWLDLESDPEVSQDG